MSGSVAAVHIEEMQDERDPLTLEALHLVKEAFAPHERQPLEQLAMEIAEKRLGLLTSYDFHLFAAVEECGVVDAISAGVYLGG
ncbi:MAG TPA: hypothetical protein VFI96_05585, partial [Longimicrobiaceae bacterium]|nr:hypothetical protein [Longimicrobiaceae bacterium]